MLRSKLIIFCDKIALLPYMKISESRRFYITYQKMKEIGPIPRKLWPFESTPGHPTWDTLKMSAWELRQVL